MQRQNGAARLFVKLQDGELVVKNDYDGEILLRGPMPHGGWKELIQGILDAAPQAIGPMRAHTQVQPIDPLAQRWNDWVKRRAN